MAPRAGACGVVVEGWKAGCRASSWRHGAVGPAVCAVRPAVALRSEVRSHRRRTSTVGPVAGGGDDVVQRGRRRERGAEKRGHRIGAALGTHGRRGLEGESRGLPTPGA